MKAAWLSASISWSRSDNSFKSSVVTVPSSTFCKNEAKLNELLVVSDAVVSAASVDVVDESVDEAVVPATAAAASVSSLESLRLASRLCKADSSSLLTCCGGGGGGGAAASVVASSDSFKALCNAVKSSSVTVPFFTLSRKEDKIVSSFDVLSLLVPAVSELVLPVTGTNP